jgi:large subunit ribosomal protein L25
MDIVKLKADIRPGTGKKGAKECRKKGLLPGILYGKGDEPTPVAVDPKQLGHALNTDAGSNVIITLTVRKKGGDPVNVVVKELQVDSLKGTMRHVDFCHISLDETIRSVVPFKIVGESPGVKQGGTLDRILWELEVESLPMDIPDQIEIDVSSLEIGDSLAVNTLVIPEGVRVVTNSDAMILHVAAPRVEEVVEEVAEEEVEGAEPEVISAEAAEGKEKSEKAEDKREPEGKRKEKE